VREDPVAARHGDRHQPARGHASGDNLASTEPHAGQCPHVVEARLRTELGITSLPSRGGRVAVVEHARK